MPLENECCMVVYGVVRQPWSTTTQASFISPMSIYVCSHCGEIRHQTFVGILGYRQDSDLKHTFSWPLKYALAFKKRRTPLGKAKVAVALLREVIRTNGECLNPVRA